MLKQIRKEMLMAKKEKDSFKSSVLATVLAEAMMIGKNDGNRETTDEEVQKHIRKTIKNLKETISLLEEGGKDTAKEKKEIEILEAYLPKQMTADEIETIVDEAISSTGATTKKEMGKVMGAVMKKIPKGTADNSMVSKLVESKLS